MVQRPETHLAGDLASTPAAQKEYELLKILAEHYFGSMLVTDDRGRFLYVSDGTCRLLGVDRETLLQLSIYDTLKGYCFATSASSIKTLETKQECLSNHTLTASGRQVLALSRPHFGPDGELQYVPTYSWDEEELVCSVVLLVFLMNTTKTSLVPDEDQGVVFVNVSTAAGSSLTTTDEVMERIEKRLMDIPQIKHVQKVAGYGLLAGQGSSFGMLILKLKSWDERPNDEDNVQAVIGQVYGRTADIKDASVFAISPGMIPGYGMGNALELHMQDKMGGDINEFFTTTQQYLGALNQRPEIAMAYSTFDVRYPQWTVEVDAAKCKRAGITPDAVLSTLSGYYGGQYVSNFNRFSKVYRVMIQADPQFRLDETSLDNAFVRMSNGEMAPLSQFVTLTRSYGAESLSRFNMYNSIAVNAMPADGYSTGDAIKAVQETAVQALPKGYGYDYGGITREENQQSGTTMIIFGICFLMIYLILSALYESFIIPFAVLLSVPCGLMGSFLFAWMFGLENNIYLQTGLIMLIGLLAKTAILLTEYAAERRKAGMGLIASAVSAAKARLRPILMTALTMIFGLFPLMLSSGVGANGNRSLGTGVVGGMTIGTLALLFIVPTLFIAFQWLQERLRPVQSRPTEDWQIEEEIKVSEEEKSKAGKK